MTRRMIIGTRGSQLALAQTGKIIRLLRARWKRKDIEIEVKPIRTEGDESEKNSNRKLTGKESFTGAIDRALLDGRIDIAVHSLKDLPVAGQERKIDLTFPKRALPFDVLISRKKGTRLESLPSGSKIGTSSLRRAVQLKSYRPDLEIVEVHGNVNTRIKKLRQNSGLDGIVLARAGLERLNLIKEMDQILPSEIMLPALGQGCLAVAVRSDDEKTAEIVSKIDNKTSRICASAERAFSRRFGGGCNLPIAGLASVGNHEEFMSFEGLAASNVDGTYFVFRDSIEGNSSESEKLGESLARTLKGMME